jgi:hypothetical protein
MTKIFQTNPRLVFSNNKKVYKFFNLSDDCKFEVESIKSSPMKFYFDTKSGYTMRIVEVIYSDDFHYVMKIAKGEDLLIAHNDQYYYLAGRWLSSFHASSYNDKDECVFLFGDYVASHLYIDTRNKEITVIDPGMNFGKIGQIEEDFSRLVVGLFQTRNFNITKLNARLLKFIEGYGASKLNYDALNKFVTFRIHRNLNKAITLDTGFKRFISAYFWLMISTIKHRLIKKNLKVILHGN